MFRFWRPSNRIGRLLTRPGRSSSRLARRVLVSAVLAAAFIVGLAGPAGATWSVVAVDTETREVGVGFASCLDPAVLGEPDEVLIPMVFAPGVGGGIYTDTVDTAIDAEMLGLLSQGFSPEQILNNIAAVQSEARARGQYSVVTVDGASAVRSGFDVSGFEEQGSSYAVQGNGVQPLVVATVVDAVEAALGEDAPIADVVVEGIVAGSDVGGDIRCGDQTALFAQVVVVGPDDTVEQPGFILTVVVDEGDGQNPGELLQAEYANGASGLVDVGTASGRGIFVYLAAGVLGLIMIGSGAVVFRYGIGNRAARQ